MEQRSSFLLSYLVGVGVGVGVGGVVVVVVVVVVVAINELQINMSVGHRLGNTETTMEQLTKRPRTEPEEHPFLPLILV
jgi:hypothetical protein